MTEIEVLQRENDRLLEELAEAKREKRNTVDKCKLMLIGAHKIIQMKDAEIDRLKNKQVLHINIDEQFQRECEYEIKKAKIEVAREIFDKVLNCLIHTTFSSELAKRGTIAYITALRKKYIGGAE